MSTSLADRARLSQQLKQVFRQSPGWAQLDEAQKEMVEVTVHCLSHIAGGCSRQTDAWQAVAHYSNVAWEMLEAAAQGALA